MLFPSFSILYTAVFNSRIIFFSFITFSRITVSNKIGFPSLFLYIFSTNISSIIPPSRDQRLLLPICDVAPNIHNLISLDAFPPNTGLSCISTTFIPDLAAAIAAHTPERPPPVMTKSVLSWTVLNSRFSIENTSLIIAFV